eukprot:g70532.t1
MTKESNSELCQCVIDDIKSLFKPFPISDMDQGNEFQLSNLPLEYHMSNIRNEVQETNHETLILIVLRKANHEAFVVLIVLHQP